MNKYIVSIIIPLFEAKHPVILYKQTKKLLTLKKSEIFQTLLWTEQVLNENLLLYFRCSHLRANFSTGPEPLSLLRI